MSFKNVESAGSLFPSVAFEATIGSIIRVSWFNDRFSYLVSCLWGGRDPFIPHKIISNLGAPWEPRLWVAGISQVFPSFLNTAPLPVLEDSRFPLPLQFEASSFCLWMKCFHWAKFSQDSAEASARGLALLPFTPVPGDSPGLPLGKAPPEAQEFLLLLPLGTPLFSLVALAALEKERWFLGIESRFKTSYTPACSS